MTSLYDGFRASSKFDASIIVPTLISTFSKSAQEISIFYIPLVL
jgi:hypothetical protein